MSIFRVKKNSNYVVMNKAALHDKNLSWKAKGIIAYMLSMPDDWTFHINELIKHSTDGEKAFRSGLKELKENGYVQRNPIREGNKIVEWETIVSEVPNNANSLLADFVQVENVDVQNRPLLSNDIKLNNNNTNNIYIPIFEHWNKQKIKVHRKANQKMISHINARLQEYTQEELIQAIDNYKRVLESSNHYFSYKWTLEDFMTPNRLVNFLTENDPLNNYLNKGFSQKRNVVENKVSEELGF